MRIPPTRKYLALLLAVSALLVTYPVFHSAPGARWLFDILMSLFFLAVLRMLFREKRMRFTALLLGMPTLAGLWTGYALPGIPRLPLVVAFHLLASLFLGLCFATILRDIFKESQVTTDSVCGALCGYLLIGLVFGHLFSAQQSVVQPSFHGSAEFQLPLQHEDSLHFVLTYFSFLTLTTVGYGDITPANPPARAFAVIEAIIGQFYLAVLIAELVGKRAGQAASNQQTKSASQER